MNHDIFISYSRKDTNIVDKFVKRLEDEGLNVWIDRDGIESGDAFKRVIVRAIKESSIVLFFASESSNSSIWTAKEINIAVHYEKPIIPIKLDDSVYNDEVEFDLVSLDYVDYTVPGMRSAMMDKLIRTVKSKLRDRQPVSEAQDGQTVPPPNPTPGPVHGHDKSNVGSKKKNKIGLWVVLGIVILGAAVAAFFLIPKSGGSKQSDAADSPSASNNLTIEANGVPIVMKPVEGGTFQMGYIKGAANQDESLAHEETVKTFYLGETEVTQELWKAVMGAEPTYNGGWTDAYGRGDNYPAYYLSWNDIQKFIRKLNDLTKKNFRLPTEAEWEFAARGGVKTNNYLYSGSSRVGDVAWYNQNSEEKPHEVKTMKPNELGIYDMSGNVWEWCNDSCDTDGSNSSDGIHRVLRGGGVNRNDQRCQVTYHGHGGTDAREYCYGFRLALSE